MNFILILLLSLYVYLSVKAIKKLEVKVDAQQAFIKEYIEGKNVIQPDNQEETTAINSSN